MKTILVFTLAAFVILTLFTPIMIVKSVSYGNITLDNLISLKSAYKNTLDNYLYEYDETHIESWGDVWYSMAKFFAAKDSYIELGKMHYENSILLIENAIDYYHDGNIEQAKILRDSAQKSNTLGHSIQANIGEMTINELVKWSDKVKKTYEYSKIALKYTAKLTGNPLLQKGVTILCVGTDLLVARGDKDQQKKIVTEAILGEIFGCIIDGIAGEIYSDMTGLSYKDLKKIALKSDVLQNVATDLLKNHVISEQIKALAKYLGIEITKDLTVSIIINVIEKLFGLLDEEYDGQIRSETVEDIASRNENYGIVTQPPDTSTAVSSDLQTITLENKYDTLESTYDNVYIEDKSGKRYNLRRNINNSYQIPTTLKKGEQYQVIVNDKPVTRFETKQSDIQIGDQVVVANTGSYGLNLRSTPQYRADKSNVIKALTEGTIVSIIDGPSLDSGYIYWKVRTKGSIEGWLATAMWLQPIEKLGIYTGSKVIVSNTSNIGLNLRNGPSISASKIGAFIEGTTLIIKDGPSYSDGYFWWHIQNPNTNQQGWCATGDWLVPYEEDEPTGECSFSVEVTPYNQSACYNQDQDVVYTIRTKKTGQKNTSIQLSIENLQNGCYSFRPSSTVTAGDTVSISISPSCIGKEGDFNFKVKARGCDNGSFKTSVYPRLTITKENCGSSEPNPIQSMQQLDQQGGLIPWGGIHDNLSVIFRAIVDPTYKKLFVEVYDIDNPSNVWSGMALIYNNNTVEITNMHFTDNTCYAWRACLEDSYGSRSDWVYAGGSNIGADFCINKNPQTPEPNPGPSPEPESSPSDKSVCSFSMVLDQTNGSTFILHTKNTGNVKTSISLSLKGLDSNCYSISPTTISAGNDAMISFNCSILNVGKHPFTVVGIGCDGSESYNADGIVECLPAPFCIEISPAYVSIEEGRSQQFIANTTDCNGNVVSSNVTWSVEPSFIGSITQNGFFTANKYTNGSSGKICANANNEKACADLSIVEPIYKECNRLEIVSSDLKVKNEGLFTTGVGKYINLDAIAYDINGNVCDCGNVSWSVSSNNLSIVNEYEGLFFTVYPGDVQIIARCGDLITSISIKIIHSCQNVCKIDVFPECESIGIGEKLNFSANVYEYVEGVCGIPCECNKMEWFVKDKKIGSINEHGVFTASSIGTTTIIASCNGFEGRACVQVIDVKDLIYGDEREDCEINISPDDEIDFGFLSRCTKSEEEEYEKRYVTKEITIETNVEDSYIIESNVQWLRTNPLGFNGKKAIITVLVFPQYIPKKETTQYRSEFNGTLTLKSKSGLCEPKEIDVTTTTETYFSFTVQVNKRHATVNGEVIELQENETPRLKRLKNKDLTFIPLRFFSEMLCYNVDWNGGQRFASVKGYGVWRKYYVDNSQISTGAGKNPVLQKPKYDNYSYNQYIWLKSDLEILPDDSEIYLEQFSYEPSTVDGYVYIQVDRSMIALRDVTEFFGGNVLWKSNQAPVICELWPGWDNKFVELMNLKLP